MQNILKLLEDIKQSRLMVEHHQSRLNTLQKSVDSALSNFKENADKDQTKKLIHHLYWHYNLTPNEISKITGHDHRQIYRLAGPTYQTQTCKTCKQSFVAIIESKNQPKIKTCTQCKYNEYQQNQAKVLTQYLGQNVPKDYSKYLRSKHWKNTRKKALERADFQCQLCACKDAVLEVHHNNYANLGAEKNQDLIALCRPCHRKFHTK